MSVLGRPESIPVDIESLLDSLPDEVAKAEQQWEKATLDREEIEAKLYLHFELEFPESTATSIKAHISLDKERHDAKMQEIAFKSIYNAKYETLMCIKKKCDLRTAF